MKMKNKFVSAGVFLLAVLLSFGMVSAFGVGSSYWKGNPFTISPGESGKVTLYLQNLIGEESVTVVTELKQGSEIASVDEGEMTIPANTQNIDYPVTITVPENTEVGTVYTVIVSFVEVGEPGSGTISVGKGYDVSFDVQIVAEPTQTGQIEGEGVSPAVWISLAILIILVIVVIIVAKRRK